MSTTHQVNGHTLTLLHNGEEYFPRLLAALDGAILSIYLETYIFAAGTRGRLVSQALQSAARRGVAVRLLLDGYGSVDLPRPWLDELRTAGVEVLWFRRTIGFIGFRRHQLRRLHRKLTLVDKRIAFVGGININDDVPDGTSAAPHLDYSVEVQGDTVGHIHASMHDMWRLMSWTNLRRQRDHEKLQTAYRKATQRQVTFLVRDNLRHRRDIERAYLKAMSEAQREILIASAYFLPGRRFRRTLLRAARRGVRVTLLLQGRVDYRLMHYATLALYDELLIAGVEIYEYHLSLLHAKVAVVDGAWATVGSSNIDPFSLLLAREANLEVRDAGFAEALRTSLLREMAHGARRVSHSAQGKHGLWKRLLMRASYAVVRFLTGMTGYARGRA